MQTCQIVIWLEDPRAATSSLRLKSYRKLIPQMPTAEKPKSDMPQDATTETEKVTMTKAISKMNKDEVIQELTNRGIEYPDKITKVEANALVLGSWRMHLCGPQVHMGSRRMNMSSHRGE